LPSLLPQLESQSDLLFFSLLAAWTRQPDPVKPTSCDV